MFQQQEMQVSLKTSAYGQAAPEELHLGQKLLWDLAYLPGMEHKRDVHPQY